MSKLKSKEEVAYLLELREERIEELETKMSQEGQELVEGETYAAMIAQRNFLSELLTKIEEKETENAYKKLEREKFDGRRLGHKRGNIALQILACIICYAIGLGIGTSLHRSNPEPQTTQYKVTAYCTCPKCCGQFSDGITASGVPAIGLICAADDDVPFGTLIDVPGYGVATVLDRGGAITEGELDVLFMTHDEALEWGVQYLDCEVLK